MAKQYEESRAFSQHKGWITILLLCLFLAAWGYTNYLLIPDTPHRWRLGNLPAVPGESIYSTSPPSPAKAPQQLPSLPELATEPSTAPGGNP